MNFDRLDTAAKIRGTYCLLLDRACQASLVHTGTLGMQKKQNKKRSYILKNHLGGRQTKVFTCAPPLPFNLTAGQTLNQTCSLEIFLLKLTCSFYGGAMMPCVCESE